VKRHEIRRWRAKEMASECRSAERENHRMASQRASSWNQGEPGAV
jgi:hypothetical protein